MEGKAGVILSRYMVSGGGFEAAGWPEKPGG